MHRSPRRRDSAVRGQAAEYHELSARDGGGEVGAGPAGLSAPGVEGPQGGKAGPPQVTGACLTRTAFPGAGAAGGAPGARVHGERICDAAEAGGGGEEAGRGAAAESSGNVPANPARQILTRMRGAVTTRALLTSLGGSCWRCSLGGLPPAPSPPPGAPCPAAPPGAPHRCSSGT